MAKRRTPEEWAAIASKHIVSCTGCCSVFEGDYVFDGDRTGVQDFLLWSMEVPEKKAEAVASLIGFPHKLSLDARKEILASMDALNCLADGDRRFKRHRDLVDR